jgi:hypothetical protein
MITEKIKTEINKLRDWDLPDTVIKWDGYDQKTMPEATSENMHIYMEKINELTEVVNKLIELNNRLSN